MEVRIAQRDCFCRGCDTKLKRNEDKGLFLYSHRNRGQNIVMCFSCIEEMHEKMKKDLESC